MSHIFSDIFEAIRYLRQEKGTTEKDIVCYVQDRTGKAISIKSVLKTLRTLQRLVDEGLLIKKGRRYMLPHPTEGKGQNENSESGDKEENNEEEEEEDEDDEEEDDEEEDEEDDDDDDEDDDDDDDDDECPDEEGQNGNDGKKNGNGSNEGNNCNGDGNGAKGGNGNGDNKNCDNQMDEDIAEEPDDEDYLWRLNNYDHKLRNCIKSEFDRVEFNRFKKPKGKNRKCKGLFDYGARGRSPMGMHSEEMEMLMDIVDAQEFDGEGSYDSELSGGFEDQLRLTDFGSLRYRSPNGPAPPNTPGMNPEGKESCCSESGREVGDVERANVDLPEFKLTKRDSKILAKARERSMKKRERANSDEEKEEVSEKISRREDFQGSKATKDGASVSLCSVCKKKKQPE